MTAQHREPDGEWATDDDLLTPLNQLSTVASVDCGGGAFAHATDRVPGFRSVHPGTVQFAFADGSTHVIPDSVSPQVMVLLSVRNDGKLVVYRDFQ